MYTNWKMKIGSLLLVVFVLVGTMVFPASADETMQIVLRDITKSDETTLWGEAKIQVSVVGAASENITAVQTALTFSGMKYKSIKFLQGENKPPRCVQISPNAALANQTGKLLPSIATNAAGSMTFSGEETPLFVLTFSGNAGDVVSVSLDKESVAGSYCIADGADVDMVASADAPVTATASDKDNKGIPAIVKLTMDKVKSFSVSNEEGYADSKITLTITHEDPAKGITISTVFNTVSIKKGGHYDSTITTPTFVVENTVISGGNDTYTVELQGEGYTSVKKTGVTFDEVLALTNADFKPGDINHDGLVDAQDKAAYEALILAEDYDERADFNRDNKVDEYDNVFGDIEGGAEDEGEGEGEGGDSASSGGSQGGGDSGSTGGNSGSTSSPSIGGNGGSSGSASVGGGGLGGIGGGSIGGIGGGAMGGAPGDGFVDLGNYSWAQDAIYSLKSKGIISGTSATTFSPANNIKRGDFILILTRMLGISDTFTENFADVAESSYYYQAIGSAKAAGIASGDGQNFMPEHSISRQDLITLAYRAFLIMGYLEETTDFSTLDAFGDKTLISGYAQAPMAAMVSAGIIKGSDGGVNPLGNATRAEVAVMCDRLAALMQ